MTIAKDVAKPFKMLSAYLTTTATIKPPPACNNTRYQTNVSNPVNNPFLLSLPKRYVTVPKGNDSKLS